MSTVLSCDKQFTITTKSGLTLISYWKFDEAGTGARADSYGVNNLSMNTVVGVSGAACVINNGLVFTTSGAVRKGEKTGGTWNPHVAAGEAGFSFCGWYKNSSAASSLLVQFSMRNVADAEVWVFGLSCTSTLLTFSLNNDVLVTFKTVTKASTNGSFHWYRASFDPSTNLIALSLDNGATSTADASNCVPLSAVDHCVLTFQKNSASTGCSFDESAIFNGILTDANATAIYNAGAGLAFGPGYPGT